MTTASARSAQPDSQDTVCAHVNEVTLCGVLAAAPESRTLPSGDEIVGFRLTVRRPPGSGAKVDSIDCVAATKASIRALARADPGDTLAVTGSLHRRFWRAGTAVASRYEVEALGVKRMRRTGR